ncbi:nicotinate-nucleotide--dimethylbenzimidazole phosphoribosyltransferase [Gracilinema caldarium]|uniref:nicotinate-nucleotide--dimethylbenzimidazole phosphoribosyltransferase n=1 Tax=Gracilinema caldarium TaxID=215591 RepID=UPI0026EBF9E3|nr:nicotinate-nucleotide--dimethylbenzimidazole phosphoribosyltransferase [Gracilinema caldarium]
MNTTIAQQMQKYLDNLTKPRGSLGRLEDLVVKFAALQARVPPRISKKAVYVFAADHGITAEGVSLYPQEVTYQMLLNILAGGAAINAMAGDASMDGESSWDLIAVDAGVATDTTVDNSALLKLAEALPPGRRFLNKKIGAGTANFLHQKAMTAMELEEALAAGESLAEDAEKQGYELVAIGDMGIGNTSTAAALLVASGFHLDDVVDRGTGIDSATLNHKRDVIAQAVEKHRPFASPRDILQKVGGYDLAMMAGLILGLRNRKIGCMIDGFPVTSAAYMAYSMDKTVTDFLFAGHLSKVKGHKPVLAAMGLEPILDLGMHLGEGTGAVLAGYILELAVKTSNSMASFESAGISDSSHEEEKY